MLNNVYTFWTGENELSRNRVAAIHSMQENIGSPVLLIDDAILHRKYLSELSIELHPAYYCLNLAHRADYLRAMFMHFFGGGYSDIKRINHSWESSFERLQISSTAVAMGYTEVSPKKVANVFGNARKRKAGAGDLFRNFLLHKKLKRNYKDVIGCGAFIFKPNTCFTQIWWSELNKRLDDLHEKLQNNPATLDPREQPGKVYSGIKSNYPIPWTYILGDIIHPLCLNFSQKMMYDLPPPAFTEYE